MRYVVLLFGIFVATLTTARAQEFRDTAGRWTPLDLTQAANNAAAPRSMAAFRQRVIIGRDNGSMLFSPDSGETWINVTQQGGLPEGTGTVWALDFSDTANDPDAVIGLAMYGSNPTQQATIIHSTDAGRTWTRGAHVAPLDPYMRRTPDSIAFDGPPVIQVVPNAVGAGTTIFISCGGGLVASTDGGTTWELRNDWVFHRFAASNSLRGVANRAQGSNFPGGVFATTDGGRTWIQSDTFQSGTYRQWGSIRAFSETQFVVFLPERYQGFTAWLLMRTSDGGMTWDRYHGRHALRPLFGAVFWQDPTDVHVVSDGAILSHSADGGEHFFVLRDTLQEYWRTDLDALWLTAYAPTAAMDDQYIYLTSIKNLAARWRVAPPQPFSAVPTAVASHAGSVSSSADGTLQIELANTVTSDVNVSVVDLLGRTALYRRVPRGEIRNSTITLRCDGLWSGSYFVRVFDDNGSVGFTGRFAR